MAIRCQACKLHEGQTTKLPLGREVIGEIPISVVQGSFI